MTKEEYQETQMRLVMLRQLADGIPLDAFLRAIERADSLGPMLDSALWIRGHGELEKIRELAKALRAFIGLPLPAYVEAGEQP